VIILIEDIMDYLTLVRNRIILIRLLPLETFFIVVELKEVAIQLIQGLHFPFKIQYTSRKLTDHTKSHDIHDILRFI